MEPRDPGVLVHVGQDVADDQDPVGLPPEDDMSGAVPGRVDHPEAADLVALFDHPVDLVARAVEDPPEEVGHEHVGLALVDQLGVLGRGYVELRAEEGNAELLADVAARALVVGVGMGEGVGGDLMPVELLQDPPVDWRQPASIRASPAR